MIIINNTKRDPYGLRFLLNFKPNLLLFLCLLVRSFQYRSCCCLRTIFTQEGCRQRECFLRPADRLLTPVSGRLERLWHYILADVAGFIKENIFRKAFWIWKMAVMENSKQESVVEWRQSTLNYLNFRFQC